MKRSQLAERNRPHRGFESQHPVAPLEPGSLEQNAMPVNFGVTTRKLRFTRASSRDNSAENDLEGKICPVREPYSTLQRARPGELPLEREFNRRVSSEEFETSHGSHQSIRSVVSASDRVLRNSQARVSSSTNEDPKLEIYRDRSPGIVASALSSVDEDFSSPVLRKSTSSSKANESQQGLGKDDRGKENQDPHGELDGTSRRSPLPEWYMRKPLQDITNVLAAGLVRCSSCTLILNCPELTYCLSLALMCPNGHSF